MKRNEKYLATCEAGGKGELASLYADFGDVRGDDFKAWWSENSRGMRLFADRPADASVRVLDDGESAVTNEQYLSLLLPLNLPKLHLVKRVREILVKAHTGKRGKQYSRNSSAKYQPAHTFSIDALLKGLAIYDYWLEHQDQPYWKIGSAQPFLSENKILPTDTKEDLIVKKNILSVTVNRYLKRAQSTIELTSKGKFPHLTRQNEIT